MRHFVGQAVNHVVAPARPPEAVFGPEPPHTWCYYFEKADLARQMGDWDQVIAWGEQAAQQGFAPAEPTEKLIFAEAYARRARWQDAARLVEDAIQERSFLKSEVCKLWWRVARETPASPENQAALDGAYRQFQCPQEPPKG
ncbi:MAG TPA: hypothetical protein VHO48_10990 [Anaerolineaceae bacterium]|nr:hypothetical protein [Anaerolineaceae bacterium]